MFSISSVQEMYLYMFTILFKCHLFNIFDFVVDRSGIGVRSMVYRHLFDAVVFFANLQSIVLFPFSPN